MITAKLKKRPTLKAVVTKPYQGKGYAEGYEDGLEKGYANGEADATTAYEAANAKVLTDCNEVLPTKGVETAESLAQVPQRIGEIESLAEAEIYFTRYGTMYRKHMLIPSEGSDGFHMYAYRYADKMETVDVPNQQSTWTNPGSTFYGCTSLKTASLPKILRVGGNFFGECTALEEVILGCEEFPMIGNSQNSFNNCKALVRLRYIGTISTSISFAQSPLLDDASIQGIVDALAEVATAQTLTLHATVGAKLTDAQKATITAKNWTLVY